MKSLKAVLLSLLTYSSIAQADKPALHGMVLFGEGEQLYASHLPMYHAPHDYQAIFKLSLATPSHHATVKAYTEAKAAGADYFTLAPQTMDLSQVINGQIKEFKATLFKGHFEKDGVELGNVSLKVEKVIIGNKLNPESLNTVQQYLVFGEKGQYYAAHLIEGKPSFDALVKVSAPTKIKFLSCRTRACSDEPIETPVTDEKLPLTLQYFSAQQKPGINEVIGNSPYVVIQKLIHFEADELSH